VIIRLSLLVVSLGLSGCGQSPERSTTLVAPTPAPQSVVTQEAGSALPESSDSSPSESEVIATPTPNASIPSRYQGYVEAYRAIQQVPPPMIESHGGLPDPNALSAYAGEVAQRAARLKAEQDALSPAQQQQLKMYRKSLEQGEEP
jgi:hypothetical protein